MINLSSKWEVNNFNIFSFISIIILIIHYRLIIIALILNKENNSLPLRGAAFTIEIPINLICAGWQGFTNVLPVHVQVYTYEMSEQRVDWLFKQAFKRLEGVAKPRLFPRRLTKDARIWIEKREESLYIYRC